MSLWKIAWRSIQHRSLASALTAFSMTLGVTLVVAVLVVHSVVDQSFHRGAQGYDLIVGPKGSSLALVFSTVFHVGKPIGTIPYSYYREVAHGRFGNDVEMAIPICLGGNYKGNRVVGTTTDLFNRLEYRDGRKYEFAEGGRNFKAGRFFEAVVGSTIARKYGLNVGSTFRPVHGFDAEQGEEHEEFSVVGVLKPTGTPNDRALFINIEGFFLVHEKGHEEHDGEHDEEHDGEHPDEHEEHADSNGHVHATSANDTTENDPFDHRKVTAVLVCSDLTNPARAIALPKLINEEPTAQAVAPAEVIAEMFEGFIGNLQKVLLVFAILIVIVAGIGIMVSIYNSMSDRRHEIAVMRALGARRSSVMRIILFESILLSLAGGLVGAILGHCLIGLMAPMILEQTGVVVGALQFQPVELILIPGLILLAAIVGYLPAVVAYRTDVAQSLSARP